MEELVCIVCGMKIHSNSYNLNSKSFINKNTQDNIISCPFCGVNKSYFKNIETIYNVDENNLNKETKKILEKAMKLEVFNGEFYEIASKLAKSEEAKKMFKDLSNIEFMHARVHKRLGGFKEMPKLIKPDYTRHNSDELLIEQAHKREEHAIAFYKRFKNDVSNKIILKVFKALSDVEKDHMTITKQ